MPKHDLLKEIREIKNQLAYAKDIGLFFGAGTSCALSIPNIVSLTNKIEDELDGKNKPVYLKVKDDVKNSITSPTIENILNKIRQIRAITEESEKKEYLGINGIMAKELDNTICKIIYKIISKSEESADRTRMRKMLAWLNMQNQNVAKEIFTPNYDLVIERSLEDNEIPYFDGFIGGYEPFFLHESINNELVTKDITRNWIRVWKLHGSLSWFWKKNADGKMLRIVRSGKISDIDKINDELVIYPSREKYSISRKQPYVTYFDRLGSFLNSGELCFIVSGYSFSDEHINEVLFNALRKNLRLSMLVFMFADSEIDNLYKTTSSYLNLTAFGPTKCIISGNLCDWEFDPAELKPKETSDEYWDDKSRKCKLGDFNNLVDFLISISGRKENIEDIVNGK